MRGFDDEIELNEAIFSHSHDDFQSNTSNDSLISIIENAAETITVKARAINRLLEWQRNPRYALFVNDKLEILEEFKSLIREENKEFSKVIREAYRKEDLTLGYSVCRAAYKMFKDYLNLVNEESDYLFYYLGLAYFNSYEARFHLLDDNKELAEYAMRKSKKNYGQAINLNLDSEMKKKIERILNKTETYLKLYRPKRQKKQGAQRTRIIGITEEDISDEEKLHEKTQELYKRFPDLFDAIYYSNDEESGCPSYEEIIKWYVEGKPLEEQLEEPLEKLLTENAA